MKNNCDVSGLEAISRAKKRGYSECRYFSKLIDGSVVLKIYESRGMDRFLIVGQYGGFESLSRRDFKEMYKDVEADNEE